jgi:mannose-6-phosphate isomerase-like protein (cupin superfamily)
VVTKIKPMKELFDRFVKKLNEENYTVVGQDASRPWGGFLLLSENDAGRFAKEYFKEVYAEKIKIGGQLSPKILFVLPERRLSWQYHHRRAEIWQVIEGKVGVIRSTTDTEGHIETLSEGDQIRLAQGERHRLVGLDQPAVLAEIWIHTDPEHPSNEEDIVRVQDDFGR